MLGRASTDLARHDSTFDVATRFDVPIYNRRLVRLEAGKVRFDIRKPDLSYFDRMSMTRVMLSYVRGERYPRFPHVRLYGGGGLGAYYFDSQETHSKHWRGGIHLLGGLEVPFPETRLTFVGEIQLHATGAPRFSPTYDGSPMGAASASVGLKIRM